MAYLHNLPERAALLDVFRRYPQMAQPLLALHEAVMRANSPLSVAQRELVASYVSGLNACAYCHGIHSLVAEAFGVEKEALESLLTDVDTARVDDNLKPILHYVRKLSQLPSRLTKADVDVVYAAGWDDKALFDAISVCALFNFMNRLVEGIGLNVGPDYDRISSQRLHDDGYAGLARLLDE